ncbi:uncharacterized protein LOC128364997 [Scomber japonicus]|uniref:uncharacterized protein LOC128364997 n=1 Tax=Scomber japonicus TaxID=13676 RepID=UPI00230662C9|nr:uncharacterized protein LOC128364997 [Scomber japonicus]
MSGIRNGLQARVQEQEPRALHVHCMGHVMNLVVQDVAHNIAECRNFMSLIRDLITLIRNSPKRLAWFQEFQSADAPSVRPLCPTRWTKRPIAHCNTANCIHRKLSSSLKCSARTSSISVKTDLKIFGKKTTAAADVLGVESPALPRPRKIPRRLDNGGAPSQSFQSPEALYRQQFDQGDCGSIVEFHGDDLEAGRLTLHRDMFVDIAKQRGVCLKRFQDAVDLLKGEQGEPLRTLLPELTKLSGQPAYEMLETHHDWTPSLLLGHNEVKVPDKDRFARHLKRHKNQAEKTVERAGYKVDRIEESSLEEEGMVQLQVEDRAQQEVEDSHHQGKDNTQEEEDRAQQEAGTVLHSDDQCEEECVQCKPRCDEINRLLEENRNLKRKLAEKEFTEEFLKRDDSRVKYYTGLPNYETFNVLLSHVTPFLPQGTRKLTPFQMILVTLMCLRLDLPLQHIGHLFDVHRGTVSAAFHKTLNVLYARLAPIVHWPDRDSLQVSMPHQFSETFGNRVAAIIDCFEVFIKRPSNLQARAQTFSHYKHSHTLKYLIGITPQGVISFISKGWGGRTSDKRITEECGFLDKLLPGDLVLADRGFDIKESVGMVCAEVKTPAFTKGQRQLDAKDVEETRSLAHLRIHVERVIGVVRNKYKILSSKIPINMVLLCEGENVTLLDKIVVVCCALTNMSSSVVL